MEICDIQYNEDTDKCEITFCSTETSEDVMKLTLAMRDMWMIKDYIIDRLSYGAAKSGKGYRKRSLQ